MSSRRTGRSGWVAALLIAVIGMPSTAMAVTLIDGKYIKPGTVKAKQLDPIQRAETWTWTTAEARVVTSSNTPVADRYIPSGQYTFGWTAVFENTAMSGSEVGCYVQANGAGEVVMSDVEFDLAAGEKTLVSGNGAAIIPPGDAGIYMMCWTAAGADVEVSNVTFVVSRTGVVRPFNWTSGF